MRYTEIDSFEKACEDLGVDPVTIIPDVSKMPPEFAGLGKSVVAFVKLAISNISINKDDNGKPTKANWYDQQERKWSGWHIVKADESNTSGSGLSFYDSGGDRSTAYVAARLTCRSEAKSDHFHSHPNFLPLWEDYKLHRD